jgi:hypothetical protein
MCLLRKLLLAACAALLASGCSTVKLAYNHADQIVAWTADDYLDLQREQQDGMRPLVERLHAWHRRTQLPDYARLLDAADKRLADGLVPADIDWVLENFRSRYEVLARRVHPDAVRVLATLSDAQVTNLERKLEDSNRKWMKEHGSAQPPEEQKRLRAKRLLERIEQWSGALGDEQSTRLTALSYEIPLITDESLRYRLRRQRDFLALLHARSDAQVFGSKLRDWLLDWDRSGAPEYEAVYARFAAARTRFYVEGFKLLDAKQRLHLASRLRDLSQAFRELADQRPQPSNLAVLP